MNGTDFFAGPMVQALGWALLHLLWQGAFVAGLLAATLSLLSKQRANVRYAVSCAALALLLTLGVATAWRVYEPVTPRTAAAASVGQAAAAVPELDTWATPKKATWKERAAAATMTARAWLPQIVILWLAGVMILSARLLVSWLKAHGLARRDAVPAKPEWQRALVRLSRALHVRRAVTLLESAAVEVPTVIGWLRPVVLLPATTLTGLVPEQIEMILAHELAHIRRHDFFVNLLQAVVETLMFYHPAVWWMSAQVRIERENCCDDLAVAVCGNPLQYARALTRLEELRSEPVQAALAANGGSLLERVRRLVGNRPEAAVGAPRYAAGLAVMTALALLLAGPSLPLLAQREEAPAARSTPSTPSAATITVMESDPAGEADDESEGTDDETDAPDEADQADEARIDAFNADLAFADATPAPEVPDFPSVPAISIAPRAVALPPRALVGLDSLRLPEPPATPAIPAPFDVSIAPMAIMASLDALSQDDRQVVRERVRDQSGEERTTDKDRKLGDGKLTVDELIALRIHGVTPEYIEEMRNSVGDLSLRDLTSMKIHGVDGRYVREMRALFGKELSSKDLLGIRVQNVTPRFVEEMRAAGLGTLKVSDIVGLKVQGVDSSYIRDLRNAGVAISEVRSLMSLKVLGVTAAFVRDLKAAGYANLSARELARLAASGVNADFVRDMEQYRTKR